MSAAMTVSIPTLSDWATDDGLLRTVGLERSIAAATGGAVAFAGAGTGCGWRDLEFDVRATANPADVCARVRGLLDLLGYRTALVWIDEVAA